MTDFKVNQRKDNHTLRLAMEGSIDEDAKFPELKLAGVQKVVIDMNHIRGINSIGIREWLQWIKPIAAQAELVFERCPKSIVIQFNMVQGFLPQNTQVSSFYVPFYCEKCDYEGGHLFTVGREVSMEGGNLVVNFDGKAAAECKESECGVEMDVTEAKYFQFLKRR